MGRSSAGPSPLQGQDIEQYAEAIAGFLRQFPQYVHRRVDRLFLPFPEQPRPGWQTTIDFTVPPLPDGHKGPALVPLYTTPKWPEIVLELKDETGRPLPILTRQQCAELDGQVLLAMARQTVPDLSPESCDHLMAVAQNLPVAQNDDRDAWSELAKVIPQITATAPAQIDRERLLLRNDPAFVSLAGDMPSKALLWFVIDASPGDRRVVQFAYDDPDRDLESERGWLGRAAVSLGVMHGQLGVPLPRFEAAAHHHMMVTAPPRLQIVDADLSVRRVATPTSPYDESRIAWACAQGDSWSKRAELSLDVGCSETRAEFHLHGDWTGCRAFARIAFEVDARGFLNGAVAAALAVIALLCLMAFDMNQAVKQADAAVSVLLVGPGLLAYALVRPSEHVLVGGYVHWMRRALIGSGVLPVAGALTVLLAGQPAGSGAVWIMKGLVILAVFVSMAFLAARLFPRGPAATPLSSYGLRRAIRQGHIPARHPTLTSRPVARPGS